MHLATLHRLYAIYDNIVAPLEKSCKIHCAHCCTRNVTLTTLEGFFIIEYLRTIGKMDLLTRIRNASDIRRFQPRTTTNRLAELCALGECLPEEEIDPSWGSCPILTQDKCPIYPVRPFGCRAMISRQNCGITGFADMDPVVFTVNHILLQCIEHADMQGYTGNLTDVLMYLESNDHRRCYGNGVENDMPKGLIRNQPIKVLMIPPEHRSRVEQILFTPMAELSVPGFKPQETSSS